MSYDFMELVQWVKGASEMVKYGWQWYEDNNIISIMEYEYNGILLVNESMGWEAIEYSLIYSLLTYKDVKLQLKLVSGSTFERDSHRNFDSSDLKVLWQLTCLSLRGRPFHSRWVR